MDQTDHASELELYLRQQALDQARRTAHAPQQWREDGDVICLACAEIISDARLRAVPNAVRCTDCQEAYEMGLRQR